MDVIFIILPLAILMAGVAVAAFFWATARGQYDDLTTPQHRAIFDDDADECLTRFRSKSCTIPNTTSGKKVR